MKNRTMMLTIGVGMLTILASSGASASTVGVVIGQGTATFPGCAAMSDAVFPVVGSNEGGTWVFAVGDSNTLPVNTACNIVAVETFIGAGYSKAGGGCLPGLLVGSVLCLGATSHLFTTVPLTLCSSLIGGCVTGSLILGGAEAA